MEGYKAKSQLLKGAYPIFTKMKRTSSYVKPGDYKTALADFEGVNPTNVRNLVLTDGVSGVNPTNVRNLVQLDGVITSSTEGEGNILFFWCGSCWR